jgi:hypothetical protein
MSRQSRLPKLEQLHAEASKPVHVELVFADANGIILDCGTPEVKPWIGRHCNELPSRCKVLIRLDPHDSL